jgi:hypothetical protein
MLRETQKEFKELKRFSKQNPSDGGPHADSSGQDLK